MTPVGDDYAQIGTVPLSTPAWVTQDLAGLYGDNDWGLDGTDLAYHHGTEPSPPWLEPRGLTIKMAVLGDADPDGAAIADPSLGRANNLDALKGGLRNPQAGTLDLQHILTGRTTRSTRCQVQKVRLGGLGNIGMHVLLDLWLPDGVMNNITAESVNGSSSAIFAVEVPNSGTAEQYSATITMTGTATQVTIATAQGYSLQVDADLSNGEVVLETGPMTAVQGGNDIHGLVSSSYPRWVPIPAGGELWDVVPVGGTVDLTVSHKAPWL